MSQIDLNIFLETIVDKKILNNVTKYCNKCYKELNENEKIYYELNSCNYLCFECAKEISKELNNNLVKEDYTSFLF